MYYPYNNNDNYYNNETNQQTPIINNYYYQTIPTTRVPSTNSNTSSNTNSTTKNTNTTTTTQKEVYVDNQAIETEPVNSNSNLGASAYNSLGASAYNSYEQNKGSQITALSLKGSGGFMPSSIWQWILVVLLILAIIVIARMIKHRSEVKEETHTTVHSH
jgi:hypothetical protein